MIIRNQQDVTDAVLSELERASKRVMQVDADVLRDLAPQGVLRAAINLGNTVLAQRASPGAPLTGVSVDLAQALAEQLSVPLEFVVYDAAGKVFGGLQDQQWDVAFLAVDETRAEYVAFSPPYLQIEGCYVVRADAPWQRSRELDVPGVRIAAGKGGAYELFLTRNLKAAQIERFATANEAFAAFLEQGFEAAAGIRAVVTAFASTRTDLRVLDDNFMTIDQAMCVPRSHAAGAAFVARFVEDMKAQGSVARSLASSGQTTAKVAPASIL
jgi:polar amino acid transport system substrate-binding protein